METKFVLLLSAILNCYKSAASDWIGINQLVRPSFDLSACISAVVYVTVDVGDSYEHLSTNYKFH
jgi:hypothetical protein